MYAITLHLGLVFISLFFLFRKDIKTTSSDLGIPFDIMKLAKYIVIGLAVIFIVSIIISQLMMHFGLWDQSKVRERIVDMPWYMLVLAVTIVPISEELFFRGLLVNKIGIIPAGILFSIAHFTYGSWAEISVTLFIGLWFGYLYKKSKSILPTMAIHFIYNLLSISIIILATRAGLL
ncbi:MAG: CPBP family intramembrane metalloprotease [Candidatus Micrarchaeota archaeon]|nr:CPBP family intramembrane metalloprotease [Candidatus Micrarchaeota archaeon]